MPSVNYYNQSAPFWDWVASMEEAGQNHPMFANRSGDDNNNEANNTFGGQNPWVQGWPAFGFGGPFAFRGRGGHGPHAHRGPPSQDQAPPENNADTEAGPSNTTADAQPSSEQSQEQPRGPGSHRGRGCGPRGRGRGPWGSRAGPHHGPPGFPPMGGFGALANMFQEQLFGQQEASKDSNDDFKPEVDVFDTPESFVVHVSLPGAKKEDVGVNWDAEKSELSVAGVVYRPGDEEFLQTLALNERKVGVFERKVRLGSRANPAAVDMDAITARMEDGVLRIEVPKLDSGYVEVKKVDIE
ncbi:uncharacterized protein LTR77_008266 [Saxophila tyrrhenica]|uniref:SHSP domain-containing protein n=1 Tax=Saxophila tyrrhenica TaxID=1690608 RepID=A0AAV9P2B0_9PEZI|nr:hypothetical protein LTR77_008266 [Saxophila tyrrhenica]